MRKRDRSYEPDRRLVRAASQLLTPFGSRFREFIAGRVLFDLACGIPEASNMPRLAAQMLGGQMYVGVDLHHVVESKRVVGEWPGVGGRDDFVARYVQSDLLQFFERWTDTRPKMIYLAGIEIVPERRDRSRAGSFFTALGQRIVDWTQPGDSVVVGPPAAKSGVQLALGGAGRFRGQLTSAGFVCAHCPSGDSGWEHALYVR